MKNKFYIYLILLFLPFYFQLSYAKDLFINASTVDLDKDKKIIFASGAVEIKDQLNNTIYSEEAEYDKTKGIVKTLGPTKIITSEKYIIEGRDIFYDDNKKIIYSKYQTKIKDIDKNQIFVQMFNYLTLKNMFFSKGDIEIIDSRSNKYSFSEIYIDEKKKKIVGSDIKSFINDIVLKDDKRNEPRFYGNSATISQGNTIVEKGVFTTCKRRENNKCPPWTSRAKKIEHNNAKKTIYYHNAVMKIYDFPVFYFPKFLLKRSY